eukprot:490525-Amphidinium_carterae.2
MAAPCVESMRTRVAEVFALMSLLDHSLTPATPSSQEEYADPQRPDVAPLPPSGEGSFLL